MDRTQDFQEHINQSETRMIKCVFPDTTNHYNTLFGGTALNWMDEVAFITATRFSRKKMVTVSLDKTDFQLRCCFVASELPIQDLTFPKNQKYARFSIY